VKLLERGTQEMVDGFSELILMHADCAAKLIKDDYNKNFNIALYHIAVTMKNSLLFLYKSHSLQVSGYESIAELFMKTRATIPNEIADLSNEFCYWSDELTFVPENAMPRERALEIGRLVQKFYNDSVLPVMSTMLCEDYAVLSQSGDMSQF
jgi:hypothetical protein